MFTTSTSPQLYAIKNRKRFQQSRSLYQEEAILKVLIEADEPLAVGEIQNRLMMWGGRPFWRVILDMLAAGVIQYPESNRYWADKLYRRNRKVILACRWTGYPPINSDWLKWNDACVMKLAQASYNDRDLASGYLDNFRLGILADALEEAGCSDTGILNHLRGPGPHVQGCSVVDSLLGKE